MRRRLKFIVIEGEDDYDDDDDGSGLKKKGFRQDKPFLCQGRVC